MKPETLLKRVCFTGVLLWIFQNTSRRTFPRRLILYLTLLVFKYSNQLHAECRRYRSSQREGLFETVILKNFWKFTRITPGSMLFLNNLPAWSWRHRLQHRCFLLILKKYSKTTTLSCFYKQPVYKQLALGWELLSNCQGSTLIHVNNNKNCR